MTGTDTPSVVLGWWRTHLRPAEDTSAARALRARLRRAASAAEALSEKPVFDLTERLPWLRAQPVALSTLVRVLAGVEAHDGRSLASQLGGRSGPDASRAMSELRFQRLLRTAPEDLAVALRRALPLADARCHVGRLGRDILNWDDPERGERARIDWCFDYFNATRERAPTTETEGAER